MPAKKDPTPKKAKPRTTPKRRAPVPVDPRETARLEGMAKCDAYGVDQVVDDILEGVPLSHIALKIGVPLSAFYRWTDRCPGASEKMYEARKKTAQAWEERAEEVVATAKTPFDLMKARELAHHYRWRAACISPKFNPNQKQDDKPNSDPVTVMQELAARLPN